MVVIRVVKEILYNGKSFRIGQNVVVKMKDEFVIKHKEKAVYKGQITAINSLFFFLHEGNIFYPINPDGIEYIELLSIYKAEEFIEKYKPIAIIRKGKEREENFLYKERSLLELFPEHVAEYDTWKDAPDSVGVTYVYRKIKDVYDLYAFLTGKYNGCFYDNKEYENKSSTKEGLILFDETHIAIMKEAISIKKELDNDLIVL